MSDLRKMARDAGFNVEFDDYVIDHWKRFEKLAELIKDAALAQPDELFCDTHCTWRDHHPDCFMARTEKGPEPEPVAYLWQHGETGRTRVIEKDQVWTASNQWNRVGPLYLHPPQRKPLTEEEIKGIVDLGLQTWKLSESTVEFARAIENAHGIGDK